MLTLMPPSLARSLQLQISRVPTLMDVWQIWMRLFRKSPPSSLRHVSHRKVRNLILAS
jgi:hypothetical protein